MNTKNVGKLEVICGSMFSGKTEELMRRLKEDVHSPGNARVNGAIVNIPEFYDAFSVKESDPMFLKEEKRAKIW